MKNITLITGNLGKVEEASRYLGIPLDHVALDLPEIQSLNSEEIVRDKVNRAYAELKKPVLVEDVSFVFKALGKLPGPLIKWFEKELGNEGLCRLVDGKDRSCVASVLYGYYDGESVSLFEGAMTGTVAEHPKGDNSFGWGPVFIPDGMNKTYAELSPEEQESVAMRKKALTKLHAFLLSA
jgi:non-canonical purine NTP pyrophosphatase (RdgB/HAM1 family)